MDIKYHFKHLSLDHVVLLAVKMLPHPLSTILRGLKHALDAVKLQQRMCKTPFTTIQKIKKASRVLFGLKKTVLFYPQIPGSHHKAKTLCALCEFKMVNDTSRDYDVSFLFEDRTRTDIEDIKGEINIHNTINGNLTDISKDVVSEEFQDIFGYKISVDPTVYSRKAVKKSNKNATHDGTVIQCPIPDSSVEEEKVYQKLIDNRNEKGFYLNYRVAVCKDIIPIILIIYRPPDDRFDQISHEDITQIGKIFTDQEINQLKRFVKSMNIDYAEMDVVRDNEDGKIYVLDVNNTPGTTSIGVDSGEMRGYKVKWRQALADSFRDMVNYFDSKC